MSNLLWHFTVAFYKTNTMVRLLRSSLLKVSLNWGIKWLIFDLMWYITMTPPTQKVSRSKISTMKWAPLFIILYSQKIWWGIKLCSLVAVANVYVMPYLKHSTQHCCSGTKPTKFKDRQYFQLYSDHKWSHTIQQVSGVDNEGKHTNSRKRAGKINDSNKNLLWFTNTIQFPCACQPTESLQQSD